MIAALLAWDATEQVVATLDYCVARDANGEVTGLVDFAAHEAAGGKLRDIWDVAGAAGSATWPEWIGARAHDFRVELDADKHITALVHLTSGHRRERMPLEAAVRAVKPAEDGSRDIRHLVGGPGRALVLDDRGRTVRSGLLLPTGTPEQLPIVGGLTGRDSL